MAVSPCYSSRSLASWSHNVSQPPVLETDTSRRHSWPATDLGMRKTNPIPDGLYFARPVRVDNNGNILEYKQHESSKKTHVIYRKTHSSDLKQNIEPHPFLLSVGLIKYRSIKIEAINLSLIHI